MNDDTALDTTTSLAVVGMAGRFPGAGDPETFWANLISGVDPIDRGPVRADGRTPGYGAVSDADLFDAGFFGFSPREALMLDPQHRVFLECAWEALENAGCDPATYPGAIGVFGGSGDTDHPTALRANRHRFPGSTPWEFRLAAGTDFLTSRVAYKLDLRGPAVTVQTACSTSLVAVHLAGQALLAGDCDLALAGGVTVHVPGPVAGEGDDDVLSPDARCRPFDAEANGTVPGNGAGVVVLKRLDDALADADRVLAVIRGSAVTNDGANKVGFLAPGVSGQAAAIRGAHLIAGVDPATIGYVEAHGTGTEVGDPIEVRALTKAFALGTDATGFCRLSSVKSSIGHTDSAAGVIGLITVILSLQHGFIPGTLHFRRPHPGLELDTGPFIVSSQPTAWPPRQAPRRAGVNSLGLGGTNAHVIVEEAPRNKGRDEVRDETSAPQLLPVSARTPQALTQAVGRLAAHLEVSGDPLADVAWTLQNGRKAFIERGFVVGADRVHAVAGLSGADPGRLLTGRAAPGGRPVAFLFPGQGGQHIGMAGDLYRDERVFRSAVDAVAELAIPELGLDLREVLYPGADALDWAQAQLDTMRVCQPVLFAVQHALTELWRARGVTPAVVLGHSLGAYAAATAAGVLDLADAMTLVLARARLLDGLPPGSMLAVALAAKELDPLLTGDLSLAAINGPEQCVVTGPADQVTQVQQMLEAREVDVRPLRISAAAHSVFVDQVLPEYAAVVASVRFRPPLIPWISDRTGALVTAEEACDPASWVAHLRETVRFSDALQTLLGEGALGSPEQHALLEVGPGRTLSTLARRHPAFEAIRPVAQSLIGVGSGGAGTAGGGADVGPGAGTETNADDPDRGAVAMLHATGRLWIAGVSIDWAALHKGRPRKVELPGYPFQRSQFRLDSAVAASSAGAEEVDRSALTPSKTGEISSKIDGASSETASVLGRTRTEKVLAAAFAEALGMPEVGLHDNYFDLGGDSLIATRILAAVRPELGPGLTARSFAQAPTIAALAALAERLESPDRPASPATADSPASHAEEVTR